MDEIKNMTKKELLAEVEKAIYTILVGGQSYKIGSRSLTRANITELKNLRAELRAEIAQEENSGSLLDGSYVAIFNGR
jgi:hypothetical protein